MTTILNFSHPLTPEHLASIEELTGERVEVVHDIKVQLDPAQPFAPQLEALVDAIPLQGDQWQTTSLLINLPGLSIAAGVLLAELHGRTGYFPASLRLRPVPDSVPLRFEVAEVIGLDQVRQRSRTRRTD